MRRVVVTGMGIACPLGVGVEHVWRRLINAESGIGPITAFDAKDLPCQMMVGISKPLTRQQGDLLNTQRTSIAYLTGSVFAAAAGRFMPVAAFPVGWAAREFTLSKLPTYHAGDVIVSLDAQVSGGIGPQRSVSSMIIKNQGG